MVGGQAYFINLDGGQARCSIGFSVEGGFVTAGHCGTVGTETIDLENQAQGEVAASVFPGDADMGFVKTEGDVVLQPFVDDFEGNALPVGGSTEAPVGSAVCRSGSTTGTLRDDPGQEPDGELPRGCGHRPHPYGCLRRGR